MRILWLQIMGWKPFRESALAIDYPPTSAAAAVVGRVVGCGWSLPNRGREVMVMRLTALRAVEEYLGASDVQRLRATRRHPLPGQRVGRYSALTSH